MGKWVAFNLFYTDFENTNILLCYKPPSLFTSSILFLFSFFYTGQQRASGLLHQWVFHFSLLYSRRWSASGPTSILWQPAAAPLVLASGGEIENTRRRDHDEADISAVWGPSQNRYHTCGPRMVSKLMLHRNKPFPAVLKFTSNQISCCFSVRNASKLLGC